MVPECLGELGTAAGDPRLDGAQRDRQHLGDLGVVEVGDVAQHDWCAELLREVVEGVVDGQAQCRRLDAAFGEHTHEEAFYQMLKLRSGDFELDPNVRPSEQVIQVSPESLLLEGMRRLDEAGR